ncbi:TRAP transporter small permease [Hoeflea poritis]|uniref:TRAP transporter small permease protein n=1 Tax=Hoeflea poritis TaxID=2993659 RepID=A0ABT4VV08_9HYPH|nr:TRAP transporter small permease [Hoeflea poritis]MDA4848530.1 TRAP transporter small permease [Hoeflea poritis]
MAVATLATAVMVVHVAADTLSRQLLNSPLPGTIEIVSHFYMTAIVFLGFAEVQRRREHATVEISSHIFNSRKTQAAIQFFAGSVSLLLVALLCFASSEIAIEQTQRGEAVPVMTTYLVVWPTRWFVVVGFATFAFVLAGQLLRPSSTPPHQ